jgi:hypothetical protein
VINYEVQMFRIDNPSGFYAKYCWSTTFIFSCNYHIKIVGSPTLPLGESVSLPLPNVLLSFGIPI